MLELIGLLGGGVLRFIPEILRLWDRDKERLHEAKMFDLQLEADRLRSKLRVEELQAATDAAEIMGELGAMQEAFKQQVAKSGFPLLDWLSSSVRPIITYWWCVVLYGGYKGCVMWSAVMADTPAKEMAGLLVSEFDFTVIGSILGFWFVDRSLRKKK